MRLLRAYVLLLFPNAIVLSSQANEENSEASIAAMGARLAHEVGRRRARRRTKTVSHIVLIRPGAKLHHASLPRPRKCRSDRWTVVILWPLGGLDRRARCPGQSAAAALLDQAVRVRLALVIAPRKHVHELGAHCGRDVGDQEVAQGTISPSPRLATPAPVAPSRARILGRSLTSALARAQATLLEELQLMDAKDPTESYIYKLSKERGFEHFR